MSIEPTHALIIGGTGMLQAASRQIVARAQHTTLVARGLADLEQTATKGSASLVALDYHRTAELIDQLHAERAAHGPFDLAVLWIHSTADDSFDALAILLGEQDGPCRIVDVLSSAVADPSRQNARRQTAAQDLADYRRVILGFVREDGRSRWLTHAEISEGVLEAIDAGASEFVVGQVRPWEQRP